LRNWAEQALTIDQFTTSKGLKAAQSFCRGTALTELDKQVVDDDVWGKLARNPQYTRVVHVKSVDPGENNIGFIFLNTVTNSGDGVLVTKQY
ncbi:hypothetical protein, partial [Vibrio sp. DNB22_12_1]